MGYFPPFVIKKSVNADPLPTNSLPSPRYIVSEKICTFADVKMYDII